MGQGQIIGLLGALTLLAAGCQGPGPSASFGMGGSSLDGVATPENPFFAPVEDREFLWNQVVDTIDDYFHIEREQRVRVLGDVLTEGRIDTSPTVGATILEPWRGDSTPGFERWHATFQSIRRRAQVRVTPTTGGYLVEVAVYKELEDLRRPAHSTAGTELIRHDGTIERNEANRDPSGLSLGWIPLGRDVSLEQKILAKIRGRLAEPPQKLGTPPPG